MELFSIIKEMVRLTATHSVRSNKRMLYFHEAIGKLIIQWNPLLSYKIEYNIDTALGTYRVDIAIFVMNTNKVIAFIPVKCDMCNINQNFTNNQNSKMGEIRKMNAAFPDARIFTLNIYPKEAPYYTKTNTIKHIEKYNSEEIIRKARETVKMARDGKNDDAFVFFVNNIYKSKNDIECTSIADFSDLDRFKKTIEELVLV